MRNETYSLPQVTEHNDLPNVEGGKIRWKVVAGIPNEDYYAFIEPLMYVTGACSCLMAALLAYEIFKSFTQPEAEFEKVPVCLLLPFHCLSKRKRVAQQESKSTRVRVTESETRI